MRSAVSAGVVLLIVLLCAGMFAATVGRVRDAAARTECQHNLKQIALSTISYADSHRRRFPAASWAEQRKVPERERFSWLGAILPYIEARMEPPFADQEFAWHAAQNREFVCVPMQPYLCPGNPDRGTWGEPGLTHYVGIAGVGKGAIDLPDGDPRAGFFGRNRTLKLDDLKRSASTTLMVMETMRDNGPWAAPGYATVRGLDPNDPPYISPEGQFSSHHHGSTRFGWTVFPVSNAAFGDASVRTISGNISPDVLESLATLAGSKTADPQDGF